MSALRIAILGDGLIGRMASVALAQVVGGNQVTLVGTGARDHGLGPGNDALTLTPDWLASAMGSVVPLDWLARHARLGWSLGTAFTGWGREAAPWFMPYGDAGAPMGTTPFHQIVARARDAGRTVRIADHALAAIAAQVERFAFPENDPRSPRSGLTLAAHVDTDALAAGFAHAGAAMGVRQATAHFMAALAEHERIVALTLADGSQVEADLFLDCSDDGGLVEQIGENDWTDWRAQFPFHRVRVTREADRAAPPPYTLVAAHRDGWRASVPLIGGRIVAEFSNAPAADAIDYAPGMRAQPWRGNCVAIGSSACRIDPLFGAPLMLATRAIERLIDLLPGTADAKVERAEYNRRSAQAAERARDTVQALYATNGRIGDAGWDHARDAPRSDLLDRKLSLYASRGMVPLDDGELFEADEWVSLLDGQGIHPRRHSPLASAHPIEAIDAHLARIRMRLIDEVRAMPTHAEVLSARG
jgi:tryptophan 7-halogenase